MLLSDLDELEDMLDDIIVDSEKENSEHHDSEDDCESEEDEEPPFNTDDFINDCLQIMHDYVNDNPCAISDPDFRENLIDHTTEIICAILENIILIDYDIENEIDNMIVIAEDLFYLHFMPPRSYPNTFITNPSSTPQKISNRLKYLNELPQPAQRTPEWYDFRHNLLTASNAYKAFENDSGRNQLIYEKCKPKQVEFSQKSQYVNVNSPMHWGQKYEPLSVMYYENVYGTKVQDFGCIQHDTYTFLGASPDGIISDHTLPRFGRMLEIKNIVNREITGIPKKEYWIQTQLQMETCDLDECDFLETRFVEYNTEAEFKADGDFLTSVNGDYKGVIMYFSTNEGKPIYIYKPLTMAEEYFEEVWEQQMMEENHLLGYTWIKNLYWKLEEVSCVLILRNKKWFQDNIHTLKELWDIILSERESGYEHRAPNKRVKKDVGLIVDKIEISGCLINTDKIKNNINMDMGKTSRSNSEIETDQNITPELNSHTHTIIKIRTESFDETKKIII